MFTSDTIFLIKLASTYCGINKTNLIILLCTSVVYILLFLIMLPINIRLAGQLIMQVFKYRFIVNNHATDTDHQVMTAYYQHFKIILGIVCCMIGFNAFNTLFNIYFSVSVSTENWHHQFQMNYALGALTLAFQEGIMLFGLTMILQISNYFEGNEFQLKKLFIAITLRMVYIFFLDFNVGSVTYVVMQLKQNFRFFKILSHIFQIQVYPWLFLTAIYCFDVVVRLVFIFSFLKMTLRIVNNYIKKFMEEIGAENLERSRYEDKIRAVKLLKIGAWGTYILCICSFLETMILLLLLLSSALSFPKEYNYEYNYSHTNVLISNICIILIAFLSILPSILYSLFLIALWLYLRHRTRVKYSGYRTMDVRLEDTSEPKNKLSNQDHLHNEFYKPKNRVLFTSYAIVILFVSLIFSLFLSPLMIMKFYEKISLIPGDYYLRQNMKSRFEFCHYIDLTTGPINEFNPWPMVRGAFTKNCSQSLKGWKIKKTENYTHSTVLYNSTAFPLWLPRNSIVEGNVNADLKIDFLSCSTTPDYFRIACNAPCVEGNSTLNCTRNKCTTLRSGMYRIHSSQDDRNYATVNVSRMRYEAVGEGVPYSEFSKNIKITELDLISFQSVTHKENIPLNFDEAICRINIFCYYNPAWAILFGFSVFAVTSFVLSLGLYCIHRYRY